MIIKFFEKEKIEKIGLDFYLVYGDNEGQKKEILESDLLVNLKHNFGEEITQDKFQVIDHEE